jgi:hypothetical protein
MNLSHKCATGSKGLPECGRGVLTNYTVCAEVNEGGVEYRGPASRYGAKIVDEAGRSCSWQNRWCVLFGNGSEWYLGMMWGPMRPGAGGENEVNDYLIGRSVSMNL